MSVWSRLVERFEAWPGWARWSSGVAAALAPLAIAGSLILPVIAERQLVQRAAERGLTARVGSARLGFGSVWFRDVVIEDPPGPGLRASLDAIQVRPRAFGGATVAVAGG